MADGAKTSTGTPGKATIEPEVAEHFAATFVPVWQLEDASFSAGGALSNEDIRALGAESRASSPRVEPQAAPSALSEGTWAELSTVLAGDPFPQRPDPTAPALPLSAAATPAAASTHDFEGSMDFRARPRKPFLVALGVGVAAVVTLVGLALTGSEAPAQQVSLATAAPLRPHEGVPIPPPPPQSDIPTPAAAETVTPQAPAPRPASPARETTSSTSPLLPPRVLRPSTDPPPAQAQERSSPPRTPVQPPGPAIVPAQKGEPRPSKGPVDTVFGI
jgi:hypothetical protein